MSIRRVGAAAWPWLAAALSGVALALPFAPWNQTWLLWIALGPWLAALWFGPRSHPRLTRGHRRTYKRDQTTAQIANEGFEDSTFIAIEQFQRGRLALYRAGLGYVAGLAFFWTAFSWIISVTPMGWFALAFYLSLFFALWSWLMGLLGDREFLRQKLAPTFTHRVQESSLTFLKSRHNLVIALLGAAAWTAQEWLRGWLFSGFGWNKIGVALHANLALIQIADITGIAGLSFMIVFVNIIAVVTVRRVMAEVGRVKLRPHWDFSAAMALVVCVFAYGVHALQFQEPTHPLRVAAIQANIPQDQKWDEEFAQHIYRTYAQLTVAAQTQHPDLLLWPEASTPAGIFDDAGTYQYVVDLAQRSDADFMLGTLDSEPTGGTYNAAVLFKNHGQQREIYHKMHLVPFGEFVPFRHSFPLFAWIVGGLVPEDILPGEKETVFTLSKGLHVAPLICFEDTVAPLVRDFVRGGAEVLINITNDGWFKKSAGSEQHLANAIFRTVELRRPLLRCANTGVTCFIDDAGRIRQELTDQDGTPFTQGFLSNVVEVPITPRTSIYGRFGEWFAGFCALLTLGFGAVTFFRR